MLLLQIIQQMDGELVRLRSLRDVVAGLATSSPKIRGLVPKPERLLQVAPPAAALGREKLPGILGSTLNRADVAVGPRPIASAVRVRVRRLASRAAVDADTRPEPPLRVHRGTKRSEPTALGKAASAGPVVISPAALVREREAKLASKLTLAHAKQTDAEPEIRPEASARELAARWLLSPVKT